MKWTRVPSLQAPLEAQIQDIASHFPKPLLERDLVGVLIVGSVSRGDATYRSDLDLLCVVRAAPLKYGRVTSLRDEIEAALPARMLQSPLPVQLNFVLPTAFDTTEKAMFDALRRGVILLDPSKQIEQLVKTKLFNRKVA